MPTGYTYIIEEGMPTTGKDPSFKEYLISCARAFDRESENVSAGESYVPKERKVDSSLIDEYKKIEDEYYEFYSKTPSEMKEMEEKEWNETFRYWIERRREDEIKKAKYSSMRDMVKAWKAPDILKDLKKFMLDQIDLCSPENDPYEPGWPKPERDENLNIWIQKKQKYFKSRLKNLKDDYEEQSRRVMIANNWVNAFHQELKKL
jgi:hypothetical protein